MHSSTKVSIIIPVYNVGTLLSRCIECCINQSFQNIEIVIVNDGSTDESGNIIERYRQADPRIKHIKKQNEGLSFARKTGLEHAVGEYIFHLDGDDIITCNAIENLCKQALLHKADIVAGNVVIIKDNAVYPEKLYSNFGSGTGVEFLEFILINHLDYLWGKLIKRSIYEDHELEMVKEMKDVPAEDQIQMFQLCMFVSKVTTIDTTVYEYRINSNSITQKQTQDVEFTKRQEYFASVLFKLLHKLPYNNLIRQQINFRILLNLYLGLHRTGHYVVNKTQSVNIMRSTFVNAVFSPGSLLFKHPRLLARCFVSLIYPKLAYKIRTFKK